MPTSVTQDLKDSRGGATPRISYWGLYGGKINFSLGIMGIMNSFSR